MTPEQQHEIAKYERAYQAPDYRMGAARKGYARQDLLRFRRGAYLDVGCGRGEMLGFAKDNGFSPVQGVEAVPALCDGGRVVQGLATEIPFPDKSFDLVTMFDVMEHLPSADSYFACRELARVCRGALVISIANNSSTGPNGDELHINRRPFPIWDKLLRTWFPEAQVARIPGRLSWSKTWYAIFDREVMIDGQQN